MFFEKVFEGKNELARWVAMILIVLLITQLLGAIPIGIAIGLAMAANPDIQPNPENPLDFTAFGISQNTSLVLMMIPFILGAIGLLLLHKPIHHRQAVSMLTGSSRFRWKRFFWGASVWMAIMAIASTISILTGYQKVELQFDAGKFFTLVGISLLVLPFQTGFEEFFFRGYLLQGTGLIFRNRWAPLLITSVIFGMLHFMNPEVDKYGAALMMPQYISFGLFFGLCTVMDDGLELAWGAHAINNIFLSLFFTESSSALQTPSLFRITETNPLNDFVLLLLCASLFIWLASRTFQWPSWSYLFGKIEIPAQSNDEPREYDEDEYQLEEQQ